mmetsp:Transcript_38600/g.86933  ORF Transcript_38600/g.86933 Transcript_38600/m.86933 type:complete len:297 (+) Transcript_38600:131-1021(+)
MVGQRLQSVIQSCGLEAEDVPLVVGTFVSAKYVTWFASIGVSIRYQPLRRLLLSRSSALSSTSVASLQPWAALRLRLWLPEAWNRARIRLPALPRRTTRQANGSAQDGAGRRRAAVGGEGCKAQLEESARLRSRLGDAWDAARSQYRCVKASCRAAQGRWHTAGRELLGRQLLLRQQRQMAQQRAQRGWYAWTSARYWQLSDKLESAASSSRVWRALSSQLRVDPKGLAMGIAEGTILYKVTFLLHAPLELLFIVQLFRRYRGAASASPPTRSRLDTDEFARELMAEWRDTFGILP